MLNYQFLAAVQLTLYAGGIVVLIIFSILLTSHIDEKMETINWKKGLFSALASFLGAVLCITTFLQYKFNASGIAAKELSISEVGRKLLGYGEDGYALPFELISVLLLAAMVAAIVIAKKEKSS
jgi:NADH-quinone oxidoreductase subunit J